MNKIVIARNGNGMVNSVSIIDDLILDPANEETHIESSTTTILSVPDANGEYGWIKNLHRVLLGKNFRYSGSVVADTSAIEKNHHEIWKTNLRKFSAQEYANQVMKITMPHVLGKIKVVSEIDAMIGEFGDSFYFPISRLLSPIGLIPRNFDSFNQFITVNKIDGLVFIIRRVNKLDRHIKPDFAMCITNMTTKKTIVTFDPEDALIAMTGKFAFAGEMFLSTENTKSGVISTKCLHIIDAKVNEKIAAMMSVATHDIANINALHL